jgi:hypothetical protein
MSCKCKNKTKSKKCECVKQHAQQHVNIKINLDGKKKNKTKSKSKSKPQGDNLVEHARTNMLLNAIHHQPRVHIEETGKVRNEHANGLVQGLQITKLLNQLNSSLIHRSERPEGQLNEIMREHDSALRTTGSVGGRPERRSVEVEVKPETTTTETNTGVDEKKVYNYLMKQKTSDKAKKGDALRNLFISITEGREPLPRNVKSSTLINKIVNNPEYVETALLFEEGSRAVDEENVKRLEEAMSRGTVSSRRGGGAKDEDLDLGIFGED